MICYEYFYRHDVDKQDFAVVAEEANAFLIHLSSPIINRRIDEANKPHANSKAVQGVCSAYLLSRGFIDERKGLFKEYNQQLRPDFYKKLGKTGIILETERGKTLHNNMDLLDLWKCHICKFADYLFLMVPTLLRQKDDGVEQPTFKPVCNRLRTFFVEGNYINVNGVFIFGY
jgi:hypothetical protein